MDPEYLHEQADRRADRLNFVRQEQEALKDEFLSALQQWKEAAPEDVAAFESLVESATLVCSSAARAHGIMMWFPNLPPFVQISLYRLCTHYHVEARLRRSLVESEATTDNWTGPNDIDPEDELTAFNTHYHFRQGLVQPVVDSITLFGRTEGDVSAEMMGSWDPSTYPSLHHFIAKAVALMKLSEFYLANPVMEGEAVGFVRDVASKTREVLKHSLPLWNAEVESVDDKRRMALAYDYAGGLLARVGTAPAAESG